MCRDRSSKSTENAIQLAHEDNHSVKATEVVLRQAQDNGVEFCPDLPLMPTLQDVKVYLSQEASRGAGDAVAPLPERGRGKITDSPQHGEQTFFMGKGKRLGVATQDGVLVRNAIGFFLYTQCRQNTRGEWPAVLGTYRYTVPIPSSLAANHTHLFFYQCAFFIRGACVAKGR
jgi:hypothetical protein